MKYHLGLGSNMGNRQENLLLCHAALGVAGVKVIKYSSVYETQPVGDEEQPWFLNQVVEVSSELEPDELLIALKQIERNQGRERYHQGKPRPIDIDILLAEDRIINTQDLKIPHPRLEKRNFVLEPLQEIAPDVVHPILGLDIMTLREKCSDKSKVKLYR